MWGAADYTLTPSAGSNNSYTGNCDVTVSGITWNITGNAQQVPWRLGGKSITKVDRTVYSKTAYTSAVSKVDLTVGAASSITVNSLKLVYSTNADFSNSSEISKTFEANSTISFEADFPANAYYKFVFNVTVSGSNNKFVEFSKVEFYNKTSGGTTPDPAPTYNITVANDIANGTVTANSTSAAEGATVTLTATPSAGYEFGEWNVTNASTSAAITVTDNKFTMPAANVNVSATFNQIQGGGEEPSGEGTTVSMTSFSAISGNVGGDTNVSYEAAKGTAGTAPAVNSNEIRVYQNGGLFTVTAATGYKLKSVTIGSSMATSINYKLDGGSEALSSAASIAANKTYTASNLNNTSIQFICKGTSSSSRLYVNYLQVVYAGSSDPSEKETNVITITPEAGTYNTPKTVSVSASMEGTSIYYTLDGTEPTIESNVYSEPIAINTSKTLKVLAVNADAKENVTKEAAYVIKPNQPVYVIGGNVIVASSYTSTQAISLSIEAAEGCEIYYTDNGYNPTTESTLYSGSIDVTEAKTFKAIAVDAYGNISSYKMLEVNITDGVVFDFTKNLYGHSGVSSSSSTDGDIADGEIFTEGGVTISFAQNTDKTQTRFWDKNGSELRIYEGSTMTFTAPSDYLISNITFQGTVNLKVDEEPISNKTWTGNQKSVTFTNNTNNSAIQTIVVNIVPDEGTSDPEPTGVYGELAFVATSGNDNYYATFSCDRDVIFPAGEAYEVQTVLVVGGEMLIESISDNSLSAVTDKTKDEGWVAGYYVPANTGVLVYSVGNESAKYYYTETNVYNSLTAVDSDYNMLHAGSEDMSEETSYEFFKLTYKKGTTSGLGFYWGNSDGSWYGPKAGGAYLAVPKSELENQSAGRAFVFDFEGTITSIENAVSVDAKNEIYDLTGRRVVNAHNGVYVVNGKKIIK